MEKSSTYYIPPFTPIYSLDRVICIGYANKPDNYIEIPFTNENYNGLLKCLQNGIQDSWVDKYPFNILLKANLLILKKIDASLPRNHLFLEYISNGEINLSQFLFNAKIVIFGAGALGANIIYQLAQFGFKNILLIDFDLVSEHDISKISIFDKEDIGRLKVKVLEEKIYFNFGTKIKVNSSLIFLQDEIDQLFEIEKPDLIVKACDPDLAFRINLNIATWARGIPCFHIAYSYEFLKIGPLYVPNLTGCDECMNLINQDLYGIKYDFKNHKRLFTELLPHPSVSFNINMCASLAIKEIVLFLSNQYEYCFSIGRLVVVNPLSLAMHYLEVNPNSNCLICSTQNK